MRSRRVRRTDEGSALIIALIFITVTSVIVAAILSFSEVGLRASKTYDFKERARSSYAAEGGIAAAIKRYSSTGPCDDSTAPLVAAPLVAPPGMQPPDAAINDRGVIVRCQGPGPAATKATHPVNSLLSLGTGSNGGITSTENLRLIGDVFSNTTVKSTAALVVQQGEVSALGTCTGVIQTVPSTPLRCASGPPPAPSTADPSRGRDPAYVPATTAVPERRTVPDCPSGWIATLEPGYYDDAAGLNALTASPSCNDKVVWFKPGTYYLDLGFRGGPNTWTVNKDSVTVVGGTPKGWDPLGTPAATLPPVIPAVPGSCTVEGDPGPGVQIIAGGATRLDVQQGRMELCATPSTADQQIALFGLGPEPPLDQPRTLEAASITPSGFTMCQPAGGSSCSPALNAQTIDEQPVRIAKGTLDATANTPPASLEFKAFSPRVPSGSLIDTVNLRVKHREDSQDGPVNVTVTADFPSIDDAPASTCGLASPRTLPARPGAITEDPINLVATCGLDKPAQLAGLAVTYTATLGSGATKADLQVDGVVVEVAYQSPVTRKPSIVQASTLFADPAVALEIGEQPTPLTTDATLTAGNPTASVTLGGLGDPPLPGDANIKSAVLRVSHQDVGYGGPKVTVPVGTCNDLSLPPRDVIADDRIDLKGCGLDTAAELTGLTATFTANGTGGTSRLDGMWLEVVSESASPAPPTLRRAASAASSSPSPPDPSVTVFADPDAAKIIGEAARSTAALSGAANGAALRVDGFAGAPFPAGSAIRSAKLRVRHQEDASVAAVGISAIVPAVPGFTGGPCPAPGPKVLTRSVGVPGDDELDLAPCGLASPEQLAGLSATYSANRTAVVAPTTQVPSTALGVGFSNAQENGRSIGEQPTALTADATLAPGATPASVQLSGLGQGAPSPGSRIETASLRVRHRDRGDIGPVTLDVQLSGSTCTMKTLQPQQPEIGVETIDLRDCNLTDTAQLAVLTVLYKAELAANGTSADDSLDGVELDLTYRPPAVATLDGIELDIKVDAPSFRPLCVPLTTGCDLLRVAPASVADTATRFVASGTIYAPTAGVDMSMYGLDTQVLRRGMIARSIKLGLQPKSDFKRPTGAIPPEIVTFTAYPDRTLSPGSAVANGFPDPNPAKDLDGVTADAVLDDDPATPELPEASVSLSAYDRSGLPDSAVEAAVLRVKHQDQGNGVEVRVEVGGTTPSPCVVTQVLAANPTLAEDQIDLGACVAALDDPNELGDVKVTYTVRKDPPTTPPDPPSPPTATVRLDGITLEILSGPLVRAKVTFDHAKPIVQEWSVLR